VASDVLRVVVIDDEAPARRKMLRFLREYEDVVVVGEAADADAGLAAIRKTEPHVVFLDVQMPGTDGFQLLELLSADAYVPHVVFVSAYDAYAVRAFDVAAVDYLLKPFDGDRFERALDRVRAHLASPAPDVHAQLRELLAGVRGAEMFADRLLVEVDGRSRFVPVKDILRVEAAQSKVAIHCSGNAFELRTTMDAIEGRLNPRDFARVHRSHIVRIDAIAELQPWFHGEYTVKLIDGTVVTWSRRYAAKRPDLLRPT
jgi:two-component system, LytTR family, response regulator